MDRSGDYRLHMLSSRSRLLWYSVITAVVVIMLSGGGYFWHKHQKVTELVGTPTGKQPRREPIPQGCLAPDEAILIELRTSRASCWGGSRESGIIRTDFRPEWGMDGSDERELTIRDLDFSRDPDPFMYLDPDVKDYLEDEPAIALDEGFYTGDDFVLLSFSQEDPVFQAGTYFGWLRVADVREIDAGSNGKLTELAGPWDEAYLYESGVGPASFAKVVFRKGTHVVEVEYGGSDKTYQPWKDEVPMPAGDAWNGAEAAAQDIAAKL